MSLSQLEDIVNSMRQANYKTIHTLILNKILKTLKNETEFPTRNVDFNKMYTSLQV